MKLWDIVKTVGGGIIKDAVPGGAAILDVVNAVLPEGSKLLGNATGADVEAAIGSLPPEQKLSLFEKQFDIDITQIKESNETVRVMLESDANNPHSTRPYIAKQSFHVIAFVIIMTVSLWAVAVATRDEAMVKAIMDNWQFVLAVIGPLVTLLWSYFGVLKNENRDRLNAANKRPAGGIGLGAVIGGLLKRK